MDQFFDLRRREHFSPHVRLIGQDERDGETKRVFASAPLYLRAIVSLYQVRKRKEISYSSLHILPHVHNGVRSYQASSATGAD